VFYCLKMTKHAYFSTVYVHKRRRLDHQNRDLGVVEGTGFCDFFPNNLDVVPWTVFRQEFQPSSIADGPFSTFMTRYLLGLKRGSRTRLLHGPWVMKGGRLMQTSGMHARGEKKPPFLKKDLDVGYYIVDADVNEVFRTSPRLSFAIASTAVITNKSKSVTLPHVDQDNAFFFMVKGSKTFRCSTSLDKQVTRHGDFTSPNKASGTLFDIVLKEGDVLFVPHHRHHCVHSEPNSIGISVTVLNNTQRESTLKVQKRRNTEDEFVTYGSLNQSQLDIDAVVQRLSKEVASPQSSVASKQYEHDDPSMAEPEANVNDLLEPSMAKGATNQSRLLVPPTTVAKINTMGTSSQMVVNAATLNSRCTKLATTLTVLDSGCQRSVTQVIKFDMYLRTLH